VAQPSELPARLPLPDRRSVVVLLLTNMSADPELEGLHKADWLTGLVGDRTRSNDRARCFLPGTLDAPKASRAECVEMRLDAFDETVAVQEASSGLEQVMDRAVAGEDLFAVCQVVEGDGGDGEVEGAADQLRP